MLFWIIPLLNCFDFTNKTAKDDFVLIQSVLFLNSLQLCGAARHTT